MNNHAATPINPTADFNCSTAQTSRHSKAPKTRPFPIRFTSEERAYLEDLAGSRPLGTYIREQLLGDRAAKRRSARKPSIDDEKASELLAAIGRTHISSNLNQIARSVNMGTLDVREDTDEQLQDACQAIFAMRDALFVALGLKLEDRS